MLNQNLSLEKSDFKQGPFVGCYFLYKKCQSVLVSNAQIRGLFENHRELVLLQQHVAGRTLLKSPDIRQTVRFMTKNALSITRKNSLIEGIRFIGAISTFASLLFDLIVFSPFHFLFLTFYSNNKWFLKVFQLNTLTKVFVSTLLALNKHNNL